MDSAPFKSPRPPAPRRARTGSMSRQASSRSLRDAARAQEEAVPVPTLPAGIGLGLDQHIKGDTIKSGGSGGDQDYAKNNNNNVGADYSRPHEIHQQNEYDDEAMQYHQSPSQRTRRGKSYGGNATMSNKRNATNGNASAAVLAKLEGLLLAKSNEIQLAGRLGEALLTQQAELESRIRDLEDEVRRNEDHDEVFGGPSTSASSTRLDDDSDGESIMLDETVREKLQDLENEMIRWERGNEEIYKDVGLPSGTGSELVRQASSASMRTDQQDTPLGPGMQGTISQNDALQGMTEDVDSNTLSPSASRRQRNAQHRANDIEFATEIGQSLLVEVRRLQALLTERDTQLAASKAERDAMERSMESLAGGLKSVEDSLEKYREENWNLEVQNQEVKVQLGDISSNLSKSESERAKLAKELSSTRDALDAQKMDNERLVSQFDALKSKHETDMANMRRTTAGLQREKSDMQAALEAAKNELALRARGIRRSVSATSNNTLSTSDAHHTPSGLANNLAEEDEDDDEDIFGTNRRGALASRRKTNDGMLDSPSPFYSDADNSLGVDASPSVRNISEAEKLRGNLAHAQKMLSSLRAALAREKEAKMSLKRKLGSGRLLDENGNDVELDDDEDDEDIDLGSGYDDEVDENRPEQRRRTITATSARGRRGGGRGRGGIVTSRRGGVSAQLPRGLMPSRLTSEVASTDEDSADGSIIERHLPADSSMTSEQEELASLPGDESTHEGSQNVLRGSKASFASIDPAFADFMPTSRSSGMEAVPAVRGTTRDNRPSSMMFASDFNLLEQIKKQEEEIAQLKAIPVPEPVETKEMGIMTDEVIIPHTEVRHISIQTEEVPVKQFKHFASQTTAEPVTKIAVQEFGVQTDAPIIAAISTADKSIMTIAEEPKRVSDAEVMTEVLPSDSVSSQTDPEEQVPVPTVPAVDVPQKIMVDRGSDPGVDVNALYTTGNIDAETSANLSMLSFKGTEEATTPTMESTPVIATKQLPDEAELAAPEVPESSYSSQMKRNESLVSQSFKSFSNRDTDYDTATETGSDFEDARETLATFNTASPGLTKFANTSQSTIMHSAVASQESDGESEASLRPTRYRRTEKGRSREPTIVKETPKPVMIDAAIQTDTIPQTMVTSPTVNSIIAQAEEPMKLPHPKDDKRFSTATFGNTTLDSMDTVRQTPSGLVYLETISPTVQAPPNSETSTLSRQSSIAAHSLDDESVTAASIPVSPSGKTRPPKLSIPPPPANPPSRDSMKHSVSPNFKPPRPSSPPPQDLLQRAQTPTFLAPGSVGRKRASQLADTYSSPTGTPNGAWGTMPVHRNEAYYGASPAPLPNGRPPTQPRSAISATQLRNAQPLKYQAGSAEPNEFGRQGAVTPINQMSHPPIRYASTRRARERSSRASMSSMGSANSRDPSLASSARTSEVGTDGLPMPGDTGLGGLHGSTDPAVIHAITQTMIGEFLFKYTRTTFTKGHSEKRHQRFFWIHPYTKTLYWSNADPGSATVNQSKAKSVFIAGVRVEKDSNPYPPGLYQTSIVISTVGREIKLTAPTKERHEMWMTAINYLLAREDPVPATPGAGAPDTPSSNRFSSFGKSVNRSAASIRFRQKSDANSLAEVGVLTASTGAKGNNTVRDSTVVPRNRVGGKDVSSMYKHETVSEPRLTPKPSTSAATKKARKMSTATSLYKRSDTPAAEYEQFIAEYGSPRSVRSYKTTGATPGTPGTGFDESMEIIDRRDVLGADDTAGYEGLENVRACCDGAHDVGKLSVSRKHHHHHHHHGSGSGTESGTVRSSMRSNSIASKASRRTTNFSTYSQEPPVPSLAEPASPSLRLRSHSATLRGLLSSPRKSVVGMPSNATVTGGDDQLQYGTVGRRR